MYSPTAVTTVRTVISLVVRVPVLSEQIRVTEPSVSTAGSLRMIAFRRAICWTPSAKVMVTNAGKPSGIAATAKPMEAEINSLAGIWCNSFPIATITTAMAAITSDSFFPKPAICLVSGVSKASMSASIVVIRPISADAPVAVTTPTP